MDLSMTEDGGVGDSGEMLGGMNGCKLLLS